MKRPCLVCGTPTNTSRCPPHQRPRHRNYKDENQRRRILKHWIQNQGLICPGTPWCNNPGEPHPVAPGDLTVDHNLPQAFGGTLHHGWSIMCRPANSRRSTGAGG